MKLFRLSISVILGLVASVSIAATAHAATFVVDSTSDQSDGVPGNGVCLTAVNTCTLRAAIQEANALAGADTVNFNIAGAGVQTIAPASALPNITEQVTIDGATQSGATCGTLVPANLPANSNTPHNLLVVINASGTGGLSSALHFADGSANSIARGLVINGAPGNGVQADSTVGGMTIECNYFGTNAAGDTAVANSEANIYAFVNSGANIIQNNLISGSNYGMIFSTGTIQNNLIGTDATGKLALANNNGINTGGGSNVTMSHNIIAGNGDSGIYMSAGNQNTITANYIGLNIDGSPLGNGGDGITMGSGSSGYTLGGVTAGAGNTISANQGNGIKIYNYLQNGQGCPSSINRNGTIQGNKIGTNSTGIIQSGYGNSGSGVQVNEVAENIDCPESIYKIHIGGSAAGASNTIAGNTQDGVRIFQNTGADVFSISTIGNSIYGNGNLGINLATDNNGDGVADQDLGPNVINNFLLNYPAGNANYYLNHPVVNSANINGSQLTVNYTFQAPPGVTENDPALLSSDLIGYQLDFYLNSAGQDGAYAGYAQGKTHLGSFIVDGSEVNASHTFTSSSPLTSNMSVSASATVLWTTTPSGGRDGSGPPYDYPI